MKAWRWSSYLWTFQWAPEAATQSTLMKQSRPLLVSIWNIKTNSESTQYSQSLFPKHWVGTDLLVTETFLWVPLYFVSHIFYSSRPKKEKENMDLKPIQWLFFSNIINKIKEKAKKLHKLIKINICLSSENSRSTSSQGQWFSNYFMLGTPKLTLIGPRTPIRKDMPGTL